VRAYTTPSYSPRPILVASLLTLTNATVTVAFALVGLSNPTIYISPVIRSELKDARAHDITDCYR
jgi:hypothetical protein